MQGGKRYSAAAHCDTHRILQGGFSKKAALETKAFQEHARAIKRNKELFRGSDSGLMHDHEVTGMLI